ncbi:MAG: MSCRAMM family protein, partial [Anaerovoracaceae bacterium]
LMTIKFKNQIKKGYIISYDTRPLKTEAVKAKKRELMATTSWFGNNIDMFTNYAYLKGPGIRERVAAADVVVPDTYDTASKSTSYTSGDVIDWRIVVNKPERVIGEGLSVSDKLDPSASLALQFDSLKVTEGKYVSIPNPLKSEFDKKIENVDYKYVKTSNEWVQGIDYEIVQLSVYGGFKLKFLKQFSTPVIVEYQTKIEALDGVTVKNESEVDGEIIEKESDIVSIPVSIPTGGANITGKNYSVTITKKDRVSKIQLIGAKFGLYRTADCNNAGLVAINVTDINGVATFKTLLSGTYYVKEIEAPEGYKLSNEVKEIKVLQGGIATYEFEIFNDKTPPPVEQGGLEIKKVDSAETDVVLAGAEFSLYDSEAKALAALKEDATDEDKEKAVRTLKTDEDGKASAAGLDHGDYWLVETKAPVGADGQTYHILTAPQKVTVDNNSAQNAVKIENEKILGGLSILKLDRDDDSKTLAGAEFSLFKTLEEAEAKANPIKTDIISDKDGKATVTGLKYGDYWLVETKAPVGADGQTYKLLTEPLKLTVNNASATETIKIENEKILGGFSILKLDKDDNSKTLEGAEFSLFKTLADAEAKANPIKTDII